jgi:rubrerythrin
LHAHLAKCLAHCSGKNQNERASLLLDYLAAHEAKLEQMVSSFESQAEPRVLNTYIYDYLVHQPIQTHNLCDTPFANLDVDDISQAVFVYHQKVIDLYRDIEARADIPEAKALFQELLALEEHEAMLLAQQTGRMRDV